MESKDIKNYIDKRLDTLEGLLVRHRDSVPPSFSQIAKDLERRIIALESRIESLQEDHRGMLDETKEMLLEVRTLIRAHADEIVSLKLVNAERKGQTAVVAVIVSTIISLFMIWVGKKM